jgi:hypothetical protein
MQEITKKEHYEILSGEDTYTTILGKYPNYVSIYTYKETHLEATRAVDNQDETKYYKP